MEQRHVVVVGLMGAGKTTVGRQVADRLGRRYRDSDDDLEALTGHSGAALAADPHVGLDELHDLEAAVLLGALADPEAMVVTAAAWVVESKVCRTALTRRATVVWLDAPADELWERAVRSSDRRTMPLDEYRATAAERRPRFSEVADVRLDAEQPVDVLVDHVLLVPAVAALRTR